MSKKYVRPFTPVWRWFIAASSVGAFVTGWAVLAHTPNPYETPAAAAAGLDAPVTETQPVLRPTQVPLQNTQPSTRQRRFQNLPSQNTLPSQGFGNSQNTQPQFQPNIQPQQQQQQLPTTRTRRLRSGGS